MPFSSARRAEDFAASLEGREPRRPLDSETAALVALVERVRQVERVELRAEFAADLRGRLIAEAEDVLTAPPVRHRAAVVTPREVRRRRLTALAAAACVTFGTGAGVAVASQSALPGESLYPVKRGIERVELTLAGSGQDRGETLLDQAGTRLTEAQELSVEATDDPRSAGYVDDTLRDFQSQATSGGEELIRVFEQDGEGEAIVELRTFVAESGERLDALASQVPDDAQDDLTEAAEALTELDAAARAACPTCSDLAPLQLSSAMISLRDEVESQLDAPSSIGSQPRAPTGGASADDQPRAALPTLSGGALPSGPAQGQPSAGPDAGADLTDGVPTGDPDLLERLQSPDPEVDVGVTTVTVPDVTEVLPSVVDPVESAVDPIESAVDPVETVVQTLLDPLAPGN